MMTPRAGLESVDFAFGFIPEMLAQGLGATVTEDGDDNAFPDFRAILCTFEGVALALIAIND